jgi:hypothetical protein
MYFLSTELYSKAVNLPCNFPTPWYCFDKSLSIKLSTQAIEEKDSWARVYRILKNLCAPEPTA